MKKAHLYKDELFFAFIGKIKMNAYLTHSYACSSFANQ